MSFQRFHWLRSGMKWPEPRGISSPKPLRCRIAPAPARR
jgi:hypothetical protein